MKNMISDEKIKFKIEQLVQKGWELANTDRKSMQHIIDEISKLSAKHHYEAGIIQSMLLEARIYANSGEYAKVTELVMQARAICNRIDDIDGKIKADHVMGFMCINQGNLETALSYYQNGLGLMKENNKEIDPTFLNNIAVIYFDTGKLDEAMEFCKESLKLAEKQGSRMQGLVLSNIAEVYLMKGDVKASLEYNNRALEILQNNGEEDHYLATCYNTYALICAYNKEFSNALENFEKCIHIYQATNNKYMEALQLFEIGKLYLQQDNYQLGIEYFQRTVKLAEDTASDGILKDIYKILSETYRKLHDYKEAYEYLMRYNEFNEKIMTRELNSRLAQQMSELKIEKAEKDAEIQRLKNIELIRQAEKNELKAELLAESYKDIKIIGEIGQKLTATLDFKKVNNMIYKNIQKLMDADVFGICLYNETNGVIEFNLFIEHGKRLPSDQIMINNENSLAARCIRTKKEILLNEIDDESKLFIKKKSESGMHPKSIIYYPLLMEDKVIGAITVQSFKFNAYTDRSLEMLKTLGSYIAIALYNSRRSDELKAKTKELERLSKTDALTGLFNRRHIIEKMEEECIRYERSQRPFCVVLLDIDHFKNINDVYGHDFGDYVLIKLAGVLKSFMRKQDILARWGGEEFLILLPETTEDGAVAFCERIRHALEEKHFIHKGKHISLTATFGIAQYNAEQGIDAVINNADKLLYVGKNSGRNRVVKGDG